MILVFIIYILVGALFNFRVAILITILFVGFFDRFLSFFSFNNFFEFRAAYRQGRLLLLDGIWSFVFVHAELCEKYLMT